MEESASRGVSEPVLQADRWLTAYHDRFAGFNTVTPNICSADLFADGDNKLLIADMGAEWGKNMQLRVYKGTSLLSEHTLVDLPLAIAPFYMNLPGPKTPAIAVASGSSIYVYRNMRPFYKYTLPALKVAEAELEAWNMVLQEGSDLNVFRDLLVNVLASGESLSAKSEHFLTTSTMSEAETFVRTYGDSPLRRQTVLTTLSAMKKSMHEEDALTCIVLGTENKDIYILEPDAFTVLTSMVVPSIPVMMDITGLFDVDYRILVACRDGCIYSLKRGQKSAKLCIELHSQAVGICARPSLGCVYVGCMDRSLRCYSTQGKGPNKYAQLWTISLDHAIVAMQSVTIKTLGLELVAVCCQDSKIYFHKEKAVVDIVDTGAPVTAVRFGRFGREDNALVFVTKSGALTVKILRRNQTFDTIGSLESSKSAPAITAGNKFIIPKKTKLFVDQTMRERESASIMHRVFQQDFHRIRLIAARHYLNTMQTTGNTQVRGFNGADETKIPEVRITARVQGLGPEFALIITLSCSENTFPPLRNLLVAYSYDSSIYRCERAYRCVPYLPPGLPTSVSIRVTCVSELCVSDTLKVIVALKDCSSPIVTALISMPVAQSV
ncbi:Bardet-Biedl syndrome 1 protein [Galendromus occidentalis]|uniref:Bardet-Biedl syndrome 1 protein n=1 Tax=Galendromus occidentalis TaxID=34638 RepID=A0AAJ6QQW9_9ACAR|nr:Bardet-Biedl syndrome 1 protein [Galendromus occidentalis]